METKKFREAILDRSILRAIPKKTKSLRQIALAIGYEGDIKRPSFGKLVKNVINEPNNERHPSVLESIKKATNADTAKAISFFELLDELLKIPVWKANVSARSEFNSELVKNVKKFKSLLKRKELKDIDTLLSWPEYGKSFKGKFGSSFRFATDLPEILDFLIKANKFGFSPETVRAEKSDAKARLLRRMNEVLKGLSVHRKLPVLEAVSGSPTICEEFGYGYQGSESIEKLLSKKSPP